MHSPSSTHELKVLSIDLEDAQGLAVSTFSEHIRYIPLEYKRSSTLQEIVKVRVFDGRIFILDRSGSSSPYKLVVFDMQGNFLYHLDPSEAFLPELTSLTDFDINQSGEVVLLDPAAYQLSVWEPSGTFVKNIPLGFSARDLVSAQDTYWFYKNTTLLGKEDSSYWFNLIHTDQRGNILNKYDPFQMEEAGEMHATAAFAQSFYSLPQAPVYVEWLNDTVFFLENGRKQPAWLMDFGKYHPTPELKSMPPIEQFEYLFYRPGHTYALGPAHLCAWENSVNFKVVLTPGRAVWVRYFPEEASTLVVKELYNDLHEGALLPFPAFMADGYAIGVIDEAFIQYYYPDYPQGPVPQSMQQLFAQIYEGSNPVLVMFNIKPS